MLSAVSEWRGGCGLWDSGVFGIGGDGRPPVVVVVVFISGVLVVLGWDDGVRCLVGIFCHLLLFLSDNLPLHPGQLLP